MQETNIILGIDPGTQLMGYALLRTDGKQPQVLLMDALKLTSYEDIYERLEKIHTKVVELVRLYKPTTFAIETGQGTGGGHRCRHAGRTGYYGIQPQEGKTIHHRQWQRG